jgi:hypothetical protein
MRRDDRHKTTVKGNDGDGWSSDDVMLWLGRRQNRNVVEWWREWPMLRWSFYSSGRWESSSSRMVARGFNASVLTWEIRRWDKALPKDEAKTASSSWLNGKELWHEVVAWRRRSDERRHRGGERDETTSVGLTRFLLGQKIKKIHAIDLASTNRRWRFKAVMS